MREDKLPYRHEMELRNVPRFRVIEYLIEAGGVEGSAFSVIGEGWQAHLQAMEPVKITVMEIRRDLLIIEGNDEQVVDEVYGFMRRKTMRGGG